MTGGRDREAGQPDYWSKILAEAATAFEPAPVSAPSLETIRQLYVSVLQQNNHTCCMTGQQFARSALGDGLVVAPIRPLGLGGALHASNLLCLSRAADQAFRRGDLTIGPNLQLIADLSRLDSQLLDKLNPNGLLRIAANGPSPDVDAIRFHRQEVFLSSP